MTMQFALNHMTAAKASFVELLDLASALGCVGIELRNDLPQPLFDGLHPSEARARIEDKGLRLLALAEVKRFNDWSDVKRQEAAALIDLARQAGAEAVSLIPRNDGLGLGNGERQAHLRLALRNLKPMLEDAGLIGLVEPLGFEICALRYKQEAVEAIEALNASDLFALVHDTFHHHLADGGPLFPQHTGIVHVSGVIDPALATNQMQDAHRVLVTDQDRLGNLVQVQALQAGGYRGAISFECFASSVHTSATLQQDLARSIALFQTQGSAQAA